MYRVGTVGVFIAIVMASLVVGPASSTATVNHEQYVVTLEPDGNPSGNELAAAATSIETRLEAVGFVRADVNAEDGVITVRSTTNLRSSLQGWVTAPGRVQLLATYPASGSYTNETALSHTDFASVSEPTQTSTGWVVPVRLTEEGQVTFKQTLRRAGYLSDGVGTCRYQTNAVDPGYCLQTTYNGNIVGAQGVSRPLANSIKDDRFQGELALAVTDEATAQRVHAYLQSEPITTPLVVQSVSVTEQTTTATVQTAETVSESNDLPPSTPTSTSTSTPTQTSSPVPTSSPAPSDDIANEDESNDNSSDDSQLFGGYNLGLFILSAVLPLVVVGYGIRRVTKSSDIRSRYL